MNPPVLVSEIPRARTGRVLIAYALMLLAAIVVFFVIRAFGESWAATTVRAASAAEPSPRAASHGDALFHVLLALVAIIVAGRGLGWIFRWLGQPPVIGEVVAGILLGPSLLGHISPDAMTFLFPADVMPHLGVLAQLGVILYMFLVGLELNGELLRSRAHATVAIS